MPTREMREAVETFLREKPWLLKEGNGALVFELACDGDSEYVVLAREKDEGTLILCPDAQALAVYATLMNRKCEHVDEMELISLYLDQDYMEFRMSKPDETWLERWLDRFGVEPNELPEDEPTMRRHEPAHLPRKLYEEEEKELALALNAAAYLPKAVKALKGKLTDDTIICVQTDGGQSFSHCVATYPENLAAVYPSASLNDEVGAQRLRRIPLNGAEVCCAIRLLPLPADDEVDRVSAVMMLLNKKTGEVTSRLICDPEEESQELALEYIGYVEEFGRPRSVVALDPRAYCLLKELTRQMSTPIRNGSEMPAEIDRAERELLEKFAEKMFEEPVACEKRLPTGSGICLYCEEEHISEEMSEHIVRCGAQHRQPGEAEYLMLRVSSADDPEFWLYVDVKWDASLRQLDRYLRDVWVDCCGHMSCFVIGGEFYYSDASEGGRGMNARLLHVLEGQTEFEYEYDFGTTTRLNLCIVDQYTAKDRRKKTMTAARNIMPVYRCARCGKRAELVNRLGMRPMAESVFCAECAKEESVSMLPLLNSPRTGVCGYGSWLFDEDDE